MNEALCRTCRVQLGGIYGSTPEGFCIAHAANGRVDTTGTVEDFWPAPIPSDPRVAELVVEHLYDVAKRVEGERRVPRRG